MHKYKNNKIMPKKATVKIGERYKDYLVIDDTPITKNQQTHFKVKCLCCNKERLIVASQLKNPDKIFRCREYADANRFAASRITVGKFTQSFL